MTSRGMTAVKKPTTERVIHTGDRVVVEFTVDEVQPTGDGDLLVLKTVQPTGKLPKYPATFVVAASAVDPIKGVCS